MNVNARFLAYEGSLKFVEVDHTRVVAKYSQIIALLKTSLTERELGLFAEPVWDASGGLSGWRARSGNPLSPVSALPAGKRYLMIEQRNRTFRKINALIESVETQGEKGRVASEVLAALSVTPKGDESLFTDGAGPVLINWACSKNDDALALKYTPIDVEGFEIANAPAAQVPKHAWVRQSAEVTSPPAASGSGKVIVKTDPVDEPVPTGKKRSAGHLAARVLVPVTGAVALAVFILDGETVPSKPDVPNPNGSVASTSETAENPAPSTTPTPAPAAPTLVEEASAAVPAPTAEMSATSIPSAPRPAQDDADVPTLANFDVAASGTSVASGDEPDASLGKTAAKPSGDTVAMNDPTEGASPNFLPEPARPAAPTTFAQSDGGNAKELVELTVLDKPGTATDLDMKTAAPELPWSVRPLPTSAAEDISTLKRDAALPPPEPKPAIAGLPDTPAPPAELPAKSDLSASLSLPVQSIDTTPAVALEAASEPNSESEDASTVNLATIENDLGISRQGRVELQQRLRLLGFDPQGVDGIVGPLTRAAITEWQQSRGHAPTGYLNAFQLAEIRKQSADLYTTWRRQEQQRAEARAEATEGERKRLASFAQEVQEDPESQTRIEVKPLGSVRLVTNDSTAERSDILGQPLTVRSLATIGQESLAGTTFGADNEPAGRERDEGPDLSGDDDDSGFGNVASERSGGGGGGVSAGDGGIGGDSGSGAGDGGDTSGGDTGSGDTGGGDTGGGDTGGGDTGSGDTGSGDTGGGDTGGGDTGGGDTGGGDTGGGDTGGGDTGAGDTGAGDTGTGDTGGGPGGGNGGGNGGGKK